MSKGLLAWVVLVVCILILLGMIFKANREVNSPSSSSSTPSSSASSAPPAVGVSYVRADASMISLASPSAGAIVPSQFALTGKALGSWYFEASFPVEVRAEDGSVIATAIAQAGGDWMTTESVPFSSILNVGAYRGPATIILKKDNPSGIPEKDASISIPVVVQ